MKVTQIEKLNQLISRTDMTGNQKVEWLINFIDEHVNEQLRLNDVSGCLLDDVITAFDFTKNHMDDSPTKDRMIDFLNNNR